MNLLAVIITYYPNLSETKKNLLQFVPFIDKLIIWENTPELDRITYSIDLEDFKEEIIYKTTGKNEYIAYPLNQIAKWALDNGYTHLLTMDQDTYFEDGCFLEYLNRVVSSFHKPIAIWSVNHNHSQTVQCDLKPIDICMTSGSIYDLNIIKMVGGFREDYEIDAVDSEICFKVRKAGFHCVVDTQCFCLHALGQLKKTSWGFYTLNYPPFRLYSITCNHILLWKEYPGFITRDIKIAILKFLIYPWVKIPLAEDNKIMKMKALFFGVLDGLSGRRKKRLF